MEALSALFNSIFAWFRMKAASRAAAELEFGKQAAASIDADLVALDALEKQPAP
jgi:hypothetical protein